MVKTVEQARTERARNEAGHQLSAITANRLGDGIVVYLGESGGWTEELEQALLAESEEALQAMQEAAAEAVARRIVIAVYPIAVAVADGVPVATSVRERIRAAHRTTLTKDWYDVPL
jgi:Protein of unknown function (DUF2849)